MDFFEQNGPGTIIDEDGTNISLEKYCVVFIAYFDEARGHQLLLVHPPWLEDDEEFMQQESKTVFIHSIWWMSVEMQEELSHVDLEFNARNYLAKKFHVPSHRQKKRSGMDENTPETIVLMLSIPISLNPFGGKILEMLYTSLREKFKDDFSMAIEKRICEAKIIKSPRDREVCQKGGAIIQKMQEEIRNVLVKAGRELGVTFSSETEKQKALSYLLYKDLKDKELHAHEGETSFFETSEPGNKVDVLESLGRVHTMVKLVDASYLKQENKINFTLINCSDEDLEDCTVSIAYLEEFFEKYFYSVDIDLWFQDEELNFQFGKIGDRRKEDYLVKVTRGGQVIFQEIITTTRMRQE